MEMNFEALLQKLTEFIQKEAKTETVIGEAFKLGEFTCVPVIRVGVGFGSGGGEGDSPKNGKGHGGGVGGGIGIDLTTVDLPLAIEGLYMAPVAGVEAATQSQTIEVGLSAYI